jgi:hypothetical protein
MALRGRIVQEEPFSHNGIEYKIMVIHQDDGWYKGVAVHNGTAIISILAHLDYPASGMAVEGLMEQVRSEIRTP